MNEHRRSPKIFFGWWMTLIGGIVSGIGSGFFNRGSSVFFIPIASEFGLCRVGGSVAAGTGLFLNYLAFPIAGWLSDKFGPKWVITAGILITGTGFILLNFVTSPWNYYLAWGLIGGGYGLGFAISQDKMLTDWFIKKRGLALGSRFAIIGTMEMLVLPLLSWLIITQSWRKTSLICAGVILGVCLPLMLYFARQKRPEYYGLLPDGYKVELVPETNVDAFLVKGVEYAAGFQETEFTFVQAIRTSAFWILTIGFVINNLISQGINIHIIPFLADMGIEPIAAAGMMSMMVFFTIPSRFFSGIAADHLRKEHLKFLLAGAILLQSSGIAAFLLSQSTLSMYVYLILFGLGSGAYVPLDALIRGRYFGRKIYGSIQGISLIFVAPLSFLSPILFGWAHDVTGNYITALTISLVIAVIMAFILGFSGVPRIPIKKA